MKVLVATAETQGDRGNDFHYAVEGELVRIDSPCARDRRDPDGGCGCGRSFAGLNSARPTTTARIADLPLSRADVAEALRSSLAQQGWNPSWAAEEAGSLLDLVADLPVGTVVGRRFYDVVIRRPAVDVPDRAT
ncbi:DUF7715 family protein [Actinomycetospora sp. CA-101289]|uniref:DUF7715 family protein n=1 Tax=Actinomycetospora sp. CA-101289 TaxID=3239893 RepID=UPI003D97DCDD